MNRNNTAQLNLLDEIIVDNFAGGGGASTGIELATGRPVTIAINHDRDAILMHKTNHPYTAHYQESVWDIDPEEICGGRPVGLAWFSPDCKHFSKAKGGKPVEKKIRGLAWIVLRWAGTVRPRVIILENVEEFQTWGPVRRGRPVKSKSGQTFRRFIKQLVKLDYRVEWRELVAADYGAPTIRKRFFMIARCDGRPIVWPEPTHAPADSPEVKSGKLLPWRSAAEIIDWSLPCPSIFDSKADIKSKYGQNAVRPLADNTQRRVIRGVDKFTIKSGRPFIVGVGGRCACCPSKDVTEPHRTITVKADAALCNAKLAPWTLTNTSNSVGAPADKPIGTARTGGGCGQMFVASSLIQYHTEQSEMVRGQSLEAPIQTVDAANRYGMASAQLTEYFGNGQPLSVDGPLHTVTAKDRECLTLAHIAEFKGQDKGQRADMPLRTITASAGEFATVAVTVRRYNPARNVGHWPEIRALLNKYCGYNLADDEIILLGIGGHWYYISDIGLRMLTPRELYAANGFPEDYIIDRDYLGNAYGKTKQVARCGNAVPPPFATALVRANLPEWCDHKISTMRELNDMVAV